MKPLGLKEQKVVKNLLGLILTILPFWNLVEGSFPVEYQQEQTTETLALNITDTIQPSESAAPQNTASLTATESSTPTIAPLATTESTPTDLQSPNIYLSGDFVSDEVLIRFRRHTSRQVIEKCTQTVNALIESEIGELTVFRIKVPEGKVSEIITILSACPSIRYVEPNFKAYIADTIPSDPDWNLQYGLVNIRAPQAWDLSTGSTVVTIAIIDSGVDLNHLDLANKIVPGFDFVNNDAIAQDDHGHGTHVAGIAAAVGNNGVGVAGVSWGARIMPVKVLNAGGNGTFADVAAGILWATDQGAQIINLSLGGNNHSQLLQDAVIYAHSHGVVIVAASGNSGSNFVLYPARYPEVIAVAATDGSNAHAGFSNYGPEVDVAAPGVSIYSTSIGGYGYRSGTSMSAPFVSGLAAILRGIPGNGSPDSIASEMESTALDLGTAGVDSFFGYGLIQMDAAIRAVLPAPNQTFTSTSTIISTSPPLSAFTFTAAPVSIPGGSPGAIPPIVFSFTASPMALLPSLKSATAGPTPIFTKPSPIDLAGSPEVSALETTDPGLAKNGQNWTLPCLGTFLIFLGIFLLWLAGSSSRNYRRIKRFK